MESLPRSTLTICAALAFLTACNGSQPPSAAPIVQYRAVVSSSRNDTTPKRLLYVASNVSGIVHVLNYPKGKSVQDLTGFSGPTGECVDKRGDVFITDTQQSGEGYIYEFQHGGSEPIATLSDPFSSPNGCTVDPATGNLAVVSIGGLAIFPNASGYPLTYTDANFRNMRYDGYDSSGDLFVDGDNASGGFGFAELPNGSKSLVDVSVNAAFRGAGAVQWDGTYITVETLSFGKPRGRPLIYRLQLTGSTANVIGTTKLTSLRNRYNGGQFWIQGYRVIGPVNYGNDVSIWNYPAGGSPIRTIHNVGPQAWGVSVSVAQ